HEHDGRRDDPPGRDAVVGEAGAEADRDREADGNAPVVADDEVPPEAGEAADRPHASTARRRSRRRWRSRTAPSDTSARKPRIARSAPSPPGQLAPAPSVAQNVPNVVSRSPTPNFSVFSGTRASGARTSSPTPPTTTSADAAAIAASPTRPSLLPK